MIRKVLISASLAGAQLVLGFDGFSTSIGVSNFNASIDNDIEVDSCFKIADLRIKDGTALKGRYKYSDSDILKAVLTGYSKNVERKAAPVASTSKETAVGKSVPPESLKIADVGRGIIGMQVSATSNIKIESGQDPAFQYAPGTENNYTFLGDKEGRVWIEDMYSKKEKKPLSYSSFLDIFARCAHANIKSDIFFHSDDGDIIASIEQGRTALKSILSRMRPSISTEELSRGSASQLEFFETIFGKDFYEANCNDPKVSTFIRDYIKNGAINTELRDKHGLVQLSNDLLNYSKPKTIGILKKMKLGNSFCRAINGFFVGMAYRYLFKDSFYIGVSGEYNRLNYKNKKCPQDDFWEREMSDVVIGKREDMYDIKTYIKDNINKELPARPLRITSIKDVRKLFDYSIDSSGIKTEALELAQIDAAVFINGLNLEFEDIGIDPVDAELKGYKEVHNAFMDPDNIIHFQIYNTLVELLRWRQYRDIIITDFPYVGATAFSKEELQALYEKYGSNIQLLDGLDEHAVIDNKHMIAGVVYRNNIKDIISFDITFGKGILNNLILLEVFVGVSRRKGNCACTYKVYNQRGGISEHTDNIKIRHWSPTFGIAAYLKLNKNISVFGKLRYIMPKKVGHVRCKRSMIYSMGMNINF